MNIPTRPVHSLPFASVMAARTTFTAIPATTTIRAATLGSSLNSSAAEVRSSGRNPIRNSAPIAMATNTASTDALPSFSQ